jgi:hypothetical protein
MPPGRMVKSLMLPPTSQVAISGSLVSVILFTTPLFDSYPIVGIPGVVQGCEEIKAIMAFSFLLWILCSSFSFECLCMTLTE